MRHAHTLRGYVIAVIAVVGATLAGLGLGQRASLADEAMLYALAILLAALAGRGPGLVAAALSTVMFDFAFVEPRYTLDVADPRFFITFGVMFAAGVAIGGLVSRLRATEEASRAREQRTAALLSFTRDAAAALDEDAVIQAVETHLDRSLGIAATVRGSPVEIDTGDAALDLEQQQFVESVGRQAAIAIERLRLADAAREAEVRATSEAMRTALLSAVSHDLRTPLAAITGTATNLRELAPPAEHEDLDTIVSESARLCRIVENLLAVTRVEGGIQPRREWVPIEELVGLALARLDASLGDRRVDVAIGADVVGHLDPILGELLLVNLLDNASKHTPANTPIELVARREPTAVVLEVLDRGPGIPRGQETHVFERFIRGAAARADSGVGLGLAVCRGISAVHAGTIEALARDGGGAVFRVRIPDAATLPRFDDAMPEVTAAAMPGAMP